MDETVPAATHDDGGGGGDRGGGVRREDKGPISVLDSPAPALWETLRPHVVGYYSDDFGERP